jgi:hypothetical protein
MQLQAADLLAWILRAESLYEFFGESYSLRELLPEFQSNDSNFRLQLAPAFYDSDHLKSYEAECLQRMAKKP